jgi:hypothetical protein
VALRDKAFSSPSLAIPLKSPLMSIINTGIPKKIIVQVLEWFCLSCTCRTSINPWRFNVLTVFFTLPNASPSNALSRMILSPLSYILQ